MAGLNWDPEQKLIAKNKGRALVKFQAQFKHCNGGDYKVVGPMVKTKADDLSFVRRMVRKFGHEKRKVCGRCGSVIGLPGPCPGCNDAPFGSNAGHRGGQ